MIASGPVLSQKIDQLVQCFPAMAVFIFFVSRHLGETAGGTLGNKYGIIPKAQLTLRRVQNAPLAGPFEVVGLSIQDECDNRAKLRAPVLFIFQLQ